MLLDQREARLTDPGEAEAFVRHTGVDALAVCIGNIHGKYLTPPELDFHRLAAIASRIETPLVLHGTSGLPETVIEQAMHHGVCKFNVNTEIRSAYLFALGQCFDEGAKSELLDVMEAGVAAMMEPVKEKIRLFRSAGQSAGLNG